MSNPLRSERRPTLGPHTVKSLHRLHGLVLESPRLCAQARKEVQPALDYIAALEAWYLSPKDAVLQRRLKEVVG